MSVREYIGARYVPLFAEPLTWDSTQNYEPLTIVLYQGNSFTSRQYVPAGIEITNEDFWALTGNYNAQIEQYRRDVAALTSELADVESMYVKAYPTVAEMKVDVDYLTPGLVCHTNGFHAVGDGGAAWYVISSSGTANEMDVISCGDLFASLVITESNVTPEMFGAYGNGVNDDTAYIQRAIQVSKCVHFKSKTYAITSISLNGMSNISLIGNGRGDEYATNGTTIKMTTANKAGISMVGCSNVTVSDMLITSTVNGTKVGIYMATNRNIANGNFCQYNCIRNVTVNFRGTVGSGSYGIYNIQNEICSFENVTAFAQFPFTCTVNDYSNLIPTFGGTGSSHNSCTAITLNGCAFISRVNGGRAIQLESVGNIDLGNCYIQANSDDSGTAAGIIFTSNSANDFIIRSVTGNVLFETCAYPMLVLNAILSNCNIVSTALQGGAVAAYITAAGGSTQSKVVDSSMALYGEPAITNLTSGVTLDGCNVITNCNKANNQGWANCVVTTSNATFPKLLNSLVIANNKMFFNGVEVAHA